MYTALTETVRLTREYDKGAAAGSGSRSSGRLAPLHGWIGAVVQEIWGDAYETHFLGEGNKEIRVAGKYNDKWVDVVTCPRGEKSKPVFCVGIKCVTRNYSQNTNNYFESMMGETANVQRSNVPYAQAIFVPDPCPYFKRKGVWLKNEKITEHNLKKYLRLALDTPSFPHQPCQTCFEVVKLDDGGIVSRAKLDPEKYGATYVQLHDERLSIEALFRKAEQQKLVHEDLDSADAD